MARSQPMTTASTPKGERRRRALVEAAAELLTEGGFDAVRHRAVAERAGLPLASTTYYFDSLDDLIAAATEHCGRTELAAGQSALERLDPATGRVETVVDLVLNLLLGPEGGSDSNRADFQAVLLRYERLVATGRRLYLRPLMRQLGTELYELLGKIFARSGLKLQSAEIERLIALVDGTVVNALIQVKPDPRAAARKALSAELKHTSLSG